MLSLDQLPLLLVCIALGLHALGERRAVVKLRRPRSREARWRAVSFYAGLVVVLVALEGPIDDDSATLLWVHMLQHVLLLSIAAPLIGRWRARRHWRHCVGSAATWPGPGRC